MSRKPLLPIVLVAGLFVLTLVSLPQPSNAAEGIPQRLSRLEGQVAALIRQVATLQAEVSSLASLTLRVRCGASEKIGDVLSLAGDRAALVTIEVDGTCSEDVHLTRNNTVLRAHAPGDGFRSLSVDGAQAVHLEGLTLNSFAAGQGASFTGRNLLVTDSPGIAMYVASGSTGDLSSPTVRGCMGGTCIEVNSGASLAIREGLIEGAGTGWGVVAIGSSISLYQTAIRGHSRGIWVVGGALRMVDGTVEENTSEGVAVTGGYLQAEGALFRDNFWVGVSVGGGMAWISGGEVSGNGTGIFSSAGLVSLRGTSVRSNRFAGVALETGATLTVGETTIADNLGDGIWLGDLSVAQGAVTVTGNQGWGIYCETAPGVAQYRGTVDASNNAAGDLHCPEVP